jgi:hypothetical protein
VIGAIKVRVEESSATAGLRGRSVAPVSRGTSRSRKDKTPTLIAVRGSALEGVRIDLRWTCR